jgi:cellulose biosynthesis protein BcsQ
LQRISVTFYAAAGGVGVTTVIATLGRILAGAGRKVALLEPPDNGVLSYYYGSVTAHRPGILTPANPDGATWFQECLEATEPRLQHLLIDGGSAVTGEVRTWLEQSAVRIVVLQPDLRSVVRLGPILESIRKQDSSKRRNAQVRLLLNQYNENVEIHREIRGRLQRQYPDSLIPVTIRRSDSVATTLAEGRTVVDADAHSGVAEDFAELAEWVRTGGQ